MKFKQFLLLLVIFVCFACSKEQVTSFIEHKTKEIFVIYLKGDWCPTCNKIDPALNAAEEFFANREGIIYLVFDQTSEATIQESARLAKQYGLEDIFEHERHTGEVLFVDQVSKKILTRFYGVNEKRIYIQASEDLMNGAQVADIKAETVSYERSKPSLEEIKSAKLFVIDIHHDLCSACSITAPIFEEVSRNFQKKSFVSFFSFDLTNRESIADTRRLVKELGLEEIYNSEKQTGKVLFVNAKTKEIIASLVQEKDPQVYYDMVKKLKKKL
jgi:thiol-disulfide isomerase/thioredoxin